MNASPRWRMLTIVRQLGTGYILVPAGMEALCLLMTGSRLHHLPQLWNIILESTALTTLVAWAWIGECHSRLALSATELRSPGIWRVLAGSFLGSIAMTLLATLMPIYLLHGPLILFATVLSCSLIGGVLVSLFKGSRWQVLLYLSYLSFAVSAGMPWIFFTYARQAAVPLAIVSSLLVAWRVRLLVDAVRNNSNNIFLRSVFSGNSSMWESWTSNSAPGTLRWRVGDRPLINAFRVALGPLLRLDEVFIFLIFTALPIAISWQPRDFLIVFSRFFYGNSVFILTLAGVTFVVARARRMAELLWNQSGEIADLALLPGLGDTQRLRRGLLREALVRPLIYYSLWFGGVTAIWLCLVPASFRLRCFLVASILSLLVLFAVLSVGLLSRALSRSSLWLKGGAYLITVPALFSSISPQAVCALRPSCMHGSNWALPLAQCLIFAVSLGSMGASLISWSGRINRRGNLLCQTL